MRFLLTQSLSLLAIATSSMVTSMVAITPSAHAASCRGGNGLGVHRTVTLDTKGGVRYGSSHGRDRSFLRDKEVVLTFDDGPMPGKTIKILHELDKHCAKATFFMVAKMAKNNPSIARKVASKGHTVGIHSYSHRNLGSLSGSAAIEDVKRSINVIRKEVGPRTAPFFRFPYLSENKSVNAHLSARDYGVFAIDVDSLDYRMSSSSAMVNRVMGQLKRKGKGIILLHDIQNVTANGIGSLLTRLKNEGYKLVHIKGRGGRDEPAPLLVSQADDVKSASELLRSDSLDSVAKRKNRRNSSKDRPKLAKLNTDSDAERKPRKTLQNSAKKKRKTPLINATLRGSIKSRIMSTQPKKRKVKSSAAKRTKVASLNKKATNKPRTNAFKRQIEKNRAAFRAAIKRRLITN